MKARFPQIAPDFSKSLNIAVVGKVGSGKRSLINAILKRSRKDVVAKVGVQPKSDRELQSLKLDERLSIIISTRFDDNSLASSDIKQQAKYQFDVGILLVNGTANASQNKDIYKLKQSCQSIFVVLNKLDELHDLQFTDLNKVLKAWKQNLQVKKIYPVSTFGYDLKNQYHTKLAIQKVYRLREDIEFVLATKGKDLLLAPHMGQKKTSAKTIIAKALSSVAIQAFLPDNITYIAATQTAAISALYYLYRGEVLSLPSCLSILSTLAQAGNNKNFFTFISSIFPGAGLVNIESAGVTAMSITLALLVTINSIWETGKTVEEDQRLPLRLRIYTKKAELTFKKIKPSQLTDRLVLQKILDEFIL
ncbi:MAG TPA: GTP-binding protein [Cyanobacteria bacterium UBA8803]|nr:GTP-binding protein [Cyanobacteria bacterium UBA8803]